MMNFNLPPKVPADLWDGEILFSFSLFLSVTTSTAQGTRCLAWLDWQRTSWQRFLNSSFLSWRVGGLDRGPRYPPPLTHPLCPPWAPKSESGWLKTFVSVCCMVKGVHFTVRGRRSSLVNSCPPQLLMTLPHSCFLRAFWQMQDVWIMRKRHLWQCWEQPHTGRCIEMYWEH